MSADVRRFGRTTPLALVTKEPVQSFEVFVVDSRTPVERPVIDIRATREAFVGASDDKKESSAVQRESVEDTDFHLFSSIESASETDIAEKARLERNLKRLRAEVQLEGPKLRDVVGFIGRMTSAFKLEAALDIFRLVSIPYMLQNELKRILRETLSRSPFLKIQPAGISLILELSKASRCPCFLPCLQIQAPL